jgi:hypothetical protein
MRRSLALGVLLVSLSSVAQGQICLGLPSFAKPMQVHASLTTGDDVTTIGGGVSWGSRTGLFGGVNAGIVSIDEVDEGAFVLGASGGYQLSTGGSSRRRSATTAQQTSMQSIQLCPVASIQYQKGPEFDILGEDIDLSATNIGAGIAAGLPIDASPTFQLIPMGSFALAYSKLKASTESFGSGSESETYGIITLGLGFLLNTNLSIRPYVDIPVGLEGADARLGVVAALSIGSR